MPAAAESVESNCNPDASAAAAASPSSSPSSPSSARGADLKTRLALAAAAGAYDTAGDGRGTGIRYWRSLSELSETPEFEEYVRREFPEQASEWHDPVSRRNFLKLMGASVAFAGLGASAGCYKHPAEKIVPYVVPPEYALPGKPMYFATAMPFNGYAEPVLGRSFSFRPTKIEGNPKHPASLGGTSVAGQASILDLYDPDRSQTVREAGRVGTKWSSFAAAFETFVAGKGGAANLRLRVLSEASTSPSLAAQIAELGKRFPQAKWHVYSPINNDNAAGGAKLAFGKPVHAVYDFSKAERIVSLDCNFLADEPGSLRHARDFIAGRRVRPAAGEGGAAKLVREDDNGKPVEGSFVMNRLYVVESTATITGASADHRQGVRARDVAGLARRLAAAVGLPGIPAGGAAPMAAVPGFDPDQWAAEVAKDLGATRGRSLVLAGRNQPPVVHAISHALNVFLGNVGNTVTYTDPVETFTDSQTASLKSLTADLQAGVVDALVILGGNPVYEAPVDIGGTDKDGPVSFAKVLKSFAQASAGRQNFTAHLSSHYDETSFLCLWHVPRSHYLESWGDVRAYDGTVSIIQPLIAPLFDSRTPQEVLAVLLGQPAKAYDVVRAHWMAQPVARGKDFEALWQASLHEGFIAGTAAAPITPALADNFAAAAAAPATAPAETGAAGGKSLEIVFRPDPNLWDGKSANNGWLQELPKPLSKLCWDNAAYISFRTARRLGLMEGGWNPEMPKKVSLKLKDLPELRLPVYVQFGQPDDSITVHLGYGRERAGTVGGIDGSTTGFNTYKLRTTDAPDVSTVEVTVTGDTYPLASTQDHQVIDDKRRGIIQAETLTSLAEKVEHPAHGGHAAVHLTLYPQYDYTHGHRWGMVIDQSACIGCNACVVACQAENNIPVVGKEEVRKSREMHWLRIDTYYGQTVEDVNVSLDNPDVYFQPMLCQHCEQAPCEVVCPVAATTHSNEGINEMTYNRCVGTRYCGNNCPYKVRRFNFLQYTDRDSKLLKLGRNPYVTVRNRGVMEKCTFCIQRINQVRIEEKKTTVLLDEATEHHDDAKAKQLTASLDELFNGLTTACQQACPTGGIVFGDLNRVDSHGNRSEVARLQEMEPLAYALLEELNTKPRTAYHAKVRNPNPALKPEPAVPAAPAAKGNAAPAAH
jgi:MoCo/4Fe-4S cofactor protein with predicted Tat translocation signal